VSRGGKLRTRYEGPESSPGFLLWQLSMGWQRRQRHALAEYALTHVQFVLLAAVAWLTGEGQVATQTRIAAHAKTDVMMTSQVLRALEKRALVVRAPHPQDTRAKGVTVTPAGRALAQRAMGTVEQADEAFFAPLGREREAFIKAMVALISAGDGG